MKSLFNSAANIIINKDTTQPLMFVNHEEANLFGFNSFRYIDNHPLIIA